jgi:ankyrin repeat protein
MIPWEVKLTLIFRTVTALHHASYFGLENTVRNLLDQEKFHIDACTKMGTTPIIKAACVSKVGHPSIVKMLLQRGANPYLGNWYGNALHCAAEAGCSTVIRQLIEYGMNPNDTEHYDHPPIYCTLDNDRSSAFGTLVELGADMNLSVFHQAIINGCFNVVDLILQRQWTQLESKTPLGIAAIHFAAGEGDVAIISRLLEAGADINILDSKGKTPLDYAGRNFNKDVARYMLSHGAVRGISKDTA